MKVLAAATIILVSSSSSSSSNRVNVPLGVLAFAPSSKLIGRNVHIHNSNSNNHNDYHHNRKLPSSATRTTTTKTTKATTYLQSSSLPSSNPSQNQDLSGGIFFDGPTDFTDRSSIVPSSSSSSPSPSSSLSNNKNHIPKDVLIIGGGLAGLSTALHISLNSNRQITILEKEDPVQQQHKTPAASFAAAGMLAPHSERLPSGPLLRLCLESRDMYAEYVSVLESITRNCGVGAKEYLWNREGQVDGNGNGNRNGSSNGNNNSGNSNGDLQPWEVGYAANGGFLAPAFAGDSVATWSPPLSDDGRENAIWLDEVQVHEMEPALHKDVIGGWWFPEDASVDARRLTCALRAACVERGVQFLHGNGCGADSLELSSGHCRGVRLEDGRVLSANSVVVANGSWMRNLLPVPVSPHKGQSFSLRMPKGENIEPMLKRVLFAQDTYIVPKADGRIVVGATVETGTFDCDVTPSGMMHCMANALQLVPALADLPVEESWAGLRPTTPDKGPILGRTKWDNLFIAGGYWRNGVLLAPKTGQLIGDLVIQNGGALPDTGDEDLVNAFNWDRFTTPEGGKALAANARYAASMHPVHKRASGVGVAASVGTELGFYSGADAAREERKKDREALFNVGMSNDDEDAFERAASLGLNDASAFSTFGESVMKPRTKKFSADNEGATNTDGDGDGDETSSEQSGATVASELQPFEGSPDALTVGYTSSDENDVDSHSLDSIYKQIQENKAKNSATSGSNSVKMSEMAKGDEEQPDPGFRIYHVEKGTRTVREVPPYTSPQEMMKQIDNEKKTSPEQQEEASNAETTSAEETSLSTSSTDTNTNTYDETTFDGYQTIQKANSRTSREAELEAMKKARMENRLGTSKIDESSIGVFKADVNDDDDDASGLFQPIKDSEVGVDEEMNISAVYEQIRSNKVAPTAMGNNIDDSNDKPDPGFRIYHVDSQTRDAREVPPYTKPEEFLKSTEDKTEQAWGE